MTLIKHIPEHNIVFLEHLSHLPRRRIQELTNFGEIIDGVAENIKDDIFVLDFSQLIYRSCVYNFVHFYF
jgi:hypothetical protein